MTGQELIEALERTGTGEKKLEVARRVVREKPGAMADEVLIALAQAQGKGGVGEGTVEKARRLMAGVPVSEFLGSPPPNAKENELRTLAKEVGKAITDQLRDKVDQAQAEGLGLPPRRK